MKTKSSPLTKTPIVPWWQPSHARDKPPYTYATLIAHAMLSSDEGCMTLHQIYQWISKKYPYYSMANRGWQNSIRHNLSLNKKKFKKLARAERHRGSHWTLLKEAQPMFIHLLTQKTEIQRQQQCHLPASVSVVTPPSKSLQPARKVKPKSRKRSPPQSDSSLLAQHTMIITGPDDFIKDNGRTSGGPLKKTRPSSLDTTLQVPPPSPPCSSTCSSPLLSSNHSLSSLSTSSLPMLDDEENRPFLMMDPLALIDHSPDPLTKYMSQDVALFSPNSPTLFTPWPTPIYASPFLEIEATTLPLVQPSWPKSTPPHDDDPSCFIHMDDYLANGMYTEFDQFFSFNH